MANFSKGWCFIAGLLILLCPLFATAQQPDITSRFSQPVALDSFVISNGFDIDAFIARVRADTTFYKAFKSMKLVPYTATNSIDVFGKSGDIIASLKSRTRQSRNAGCRTTKVLESNTTGDFYKPDSSYNYFTAGFYAYLFFADEPVCGETDIIAGNVDAPGKGQMEKSTYQLKQLIFNPGGRVSGVPFMGSRASIFDAGEAEKYIFRITRDQLDGTFCFVFRITPKPGYEHKVLYNELTTWFRVSDYSIIARNYALSYHTLVYDFDVTMKVRTSEMGGKLYPTSIGYDGNWHIVMHKRERVKFNIGISY